MDGRIGWMDRMDAVTIASCFHDCKLTNVTSTIDLSTDNVTFQHPLELKNGRSA